MDSINRTSDGGENLESTIALLAQEWNQIEDVKSRITKLHPNITVHSFSFKRHDKTAGVACWWKG